MVMNARRNRVVTTCVAVLAAVLWLGALPPPAEGDLVFVLSESENAITAVTTGFDSLPVDHVAIVHRIGGDNGPSTSLRRCHGMEWCSLRWIPY